MDWHAPALTLLDRLPATERDKVLESARVVSFAAGAQLFGTPLERDCLFLDDGLASLHVRVGSRLSGSVGLVGRSGMLGVPSLLGTDAPHHLALAVTRVRARAIPTPDLRNCIHRLPQLRRAVSRYVSHRFAQALVCSACNLEHGLGPRLADWIAQAGGLLGEEAIPVTHERLAIILGAARPSVTLALQSLEEQKAVSSRRGHILVRDAARLASLACGCGSGACRTVSNHTEQEQPLSP